MTGAAAYLLHTPPSCHSVHIVDASIIGAHLRRAEEALYRGIEGPTSHLVNQHALNQIVEELRRLPRTIAERQHWVVRQSAHLAVLMEKPDFAAAHAKAPLVLLVLPKGHATHLVPRDDGELEPHVPSMQALQQVTEMEWRSLAARTKAHTPLADACEAVPVGAVHHGPTHSNLLRAHDGCLSTMQVMWRWQQKVTRTVMPAHPCIFCEGPGEDTSHMSGYPPLPPPPPRYPPPHAHDQPQQSYHQDPQWPTYPPPPRGPPPPPPHGAPSRGPPPSLPYGTPPGATAEPPELQPKALLGTFTNVAQIGKVRGRLRNQPDHTSYVAAFNAWFVRSRESHVCGPQVLSAQCSATRWPPLCFYRIRRRPARRGTNSPRASEQKDLAPVPWRSSRSLCWVFSTRASLSPPKVAALRVPRSARSTCRASAVPLEERRHVVRVLHKLPPETKGEEAKEGPKEAAEGAAEEAAARAEVSAGGDGGPAGEQVRVAVSLPFACPARMVLLCLWNPPRRVLRVLRVLRVTCVSILALLCRTGPRFPRSARASASEGGAPRLPGKPCRTGRGSRYGGGSRGQDDGQRHPRIVEGWEGWEGEQGWEREGSEGFFSPLGEPSPEWPEPDESRGRQSSQPALWVPPWEVSAQTGSFSQHALDWWRCNMW